MPTALVDLTVLATDARTRGIGRYVGDLAIGLKRCVANSPDLRVLGIERLHWLGTADVSEDLAAIVARLTAPGQRPEPHMRWAYRLRVALAPAVRALAPDLVHLGHPNATPLGALNCARIVTCHDLIPLRYPDRYLDWRDGYRAGRERLDHRRYHSADHVICVSETTANDLMTLLGVAAKKISVVYNGVELERWSPEPGLGDGEVRARYGLSEHSYVLYVGAADWRKNRSGMLRALAQARKQAPDQDILFAWAAKLSPDDQRGVLRQARELGVEDAVKLLGYVSDEDLAALYRGAVAQLFVSRAEGFGYPVVEAMAAGCPVITSDRSSTVEIAGDAAVLCDPENTDQIADGIVTLAGSPRERQRLSRLGTERAKSFSVERMAERTLGVYRDVMRAGRP